MNPFGSVDDPVDSYNPFEGEKKETTTTGKDRLIVRHFIRW